MAYSADISGLSADHHWKFDGDSSDAIGSATGTDTSIVYTSSAIAEDATNSAEMNAVGDRISIPTTTDINNSTQAIKSVGGWFWTSANQQPFVRIYGEGNATTNFHLAMGLGNNLTFEIRDGANFQCQVYNDTPIAKSRAYHILMRFSDSANDNLVDLFIDGVKMLRAEPSDREPDDAGLGARGVAEFGDPAGTVGLDGSALLMVAPGQQGTSRYNHWATWDGTELTDTEVRETLFERGTLADVTISSGTESAMQTALDAYSASTRSDAPCCIEIEAVSSGGDFTLDVDDITFNALASIHIRYNGTADKLTLRNTNGSNCSIVSAPFGGTVALFTEQTLTVTAKDAVALTDVQSARVLLEADTGGDLPAKASVTITRSGSTATVAHTAHGVADGSQIDIRKANQPEYNGVKTITVTGANSYTYTVTGTPTTPATGSITATAVLVNDTTDVDGEATATFDYSADQPVTGVVRKNTSSPRYKTGKLGGTITTDGYDAVSFLVPDE